MYEPLDEKLPSSEASPEDNYIAKLEIVDVLQQIHKLPEHEKEVVLCICLFITAFMGVIKYDSEDVSIKYTARIAQTENGTEYQVDFDFSSPENTVLMERHNRDYTDFSSSDSITFYKVLKLPFDDLGKYPNKYSSGYASTAPFTDNDIVTFIFNDKTITYNLREIAKKEGIQ